MKSIRHAETPKLAQPICGRTGMLILILVLVLLFGGGFGYRYRDNYGPHIGIGTILLIVILFFLLNGRL